MPIHYEISPAVYDYIISDEEWLWQMLLNYLTNACKYTDRGSITVRVSLVDANPSSSRLLDHACLPASCVAIAASSAASAASDYGNSATDARCILTTEGTASINGEQWDSTTENSSKLLFEVADTGEV